MKDILIVASILAGWIVLNLWVLPWFGIQTCMSGACRVPRVQQAEPRDTTDKLVHENHATRESKRR